MSAEAEHGRRVAAEPDGSSQSRFGSRTFRLGLGAACVLFVAMAFAVVPTDSFSRDDFAFLYRVQTQPWSFAGVYLPFSERFWWSYRPLGMDTFFYACHALYGLNSNGYFASALLVHLAGAPLVYRIAIQLGFDARIACVTALLAVSRHATLNEIYYASDFHYVGCAFFVLISITCQIDHVRRGSWGAWALSMLALTAALLCNEFALLLPLFFVALSGWASFTDERGGFTGGDTRGATRALLWRVARTLPHFAVAGLYLMMRFRWIGPPLHDLRYGLHFGGWHVATHARKQVFFVFGSELLLWGAVVVVAFTLALLWRSERRREITSWLVPTLMITCVWLLGALAPFVVLQRKAPRFSTALEAPVCLLFGAFLCVLWKLHGKRFARGLELGLIAMVFAALPYHTLWERSQTHHGAAALNLARAVEVHYPKISAYRKLVLLYNAPGLANRFSANLFRMNTTGGAALRVYRREDIPPIEFHDLEQKPYVGVCHGCAFLQIEPQLGVSRADRSLLRGTGPARPKGRVWPRANSR